ncbi:unnamed protein product [Plutella xylostella]|uniref:alpha-glucosidase n=1 Tax=Plutella xylostella TaxID=51655 RepID=A0A8S4F4F0_PLUXY|nr:unnamed protein product [Plutella xylostella]
MACPIPSRGPPTALVMWWAPLLLVLPAVSAADPAPWWASAVYYRVLVDSFKDGDGDGLGDLMGAIKQISYVRALGADAVILSPLVAKSAECAAPGVLDHTLQDTRYGNIETLTALLDKAKKLELKAVITVPLQTVSSKSDWFGASANRTSGFEDWILWKDGNPDEVPPAEPGVPFWIWHEERKAYWASSNREAILNLCSEGLSAALATAQCAWLRRGFNGVLLTLDYLVDQTCAEKLVRKMAAEAMSCVRASNLETPVILVESSQSPEISARYYADGGVGANSVLSTAMTAAARTSAADMALAMYAGILNAPVDGVPTWMTSYTNESRLATRLGNEMVDAINLLTLTLPGAAIIQQGDELGAADTILEMSAAAETCWPEQPSPALAPFSWDDKPNAGFTGGNPWIPLSPNYRYANAKTQFNNDGSHAGVVRVAAAMRKSPAIGPHVEIKRLGQAVAVLRWGGHGSLMAVANVGRDQTEAQLSRVPGLPAEMTVAASSAGSSLSPGSHVSLEKMLKLSPGEAVLLAGAPRHCGGPGPVDKITSKLAEGWQKINKYFNN